VVVLGDTTVVTIGEVCGTGVDVAAGRGDDSGANGCIERGVDLVGFGES
jgi:hypothetical protein